MRSRRRRRRLRRSRKIEYPYCRISGSQIHGIGVFAIRDIPMGVQPFEMRDNPGEIVDEGGLDEEVVKMYQAYYCTPPGKVFLPERRDGIPVNLASLVNHSDKPNIVYERRNGSYLTLSPIQKGQELTQDYGMLCGKNSPLLKRNQS